MNGEAKNTCENCLWSKDADFNGNKNFFDCINPKVTNGKLEGITQYDDNTSFVTVGKNFGCIHFRNK